MSQGWSKKNHLSSLCVVMCAAAHSVTNIFVFSFTRVTLSSSYLSQNQPTVQNQLQFYLFGYYTVSPHFSSIWHWNWWNWGSVTTNTRGNQDLQNARRVFTPTNQHKNRLSVNKPGRRAEQVRVVNKSRGVVWQEKGAHEECPAGDSDHGTFLVWLKLKKTWVILPPDFWSTINRVSKLKQFVLKLNY